MSLRSTILPLLPLILIGSSLGACDKQDSVTGQPNAAASVDTAATNAVIANESEKVVVDTIGTLDRSHRGEAASMLPFQAPGGGRTSLAAFGGKPVLLNLWATWCAPCVAEMPTLDTVAERMQVVAVSQDLNGEDKVTAFVGKAGLRNIKPYLDPGATLSVAYQASLPTSILYDSHGKEVWRMTGGMDWTSETAKDLLAEAN